jgi:hypothetical protein
MPLRREQITNSCRQFGLMVDTPRPEPYLSDFFGGFPRKTVSTHFVLSEIGVRSQHLKRTGVASFRRRLKSEVRIRHCLEMAGCLPRRIYFWTLPVAVFGSSGTK